MHAQFKHGLLWQDYQHEQLLTYLSSLNHARGTQKESSEFHKMLEFLQYYTQSHFELEEAYMKDLNFPEFDDHLKEHKEFMKMVQTFKEKSESPEETSVLIAELCDWLQKHILVSDKDLAEYILAHNP